MVDYQQFKMNLRAQFVDSNDVPLKDCAAAFQKYFDIDGNPGTGSKFESIVDIDRPYEITARDFCAVSMLGVDIPPRPALWILGDEGRKVISEKLRQVPNDVDIWDDKAIDLFRDDGELIQLWNYLGTAYWPIPRTKNGLGITLRSKILAAKRPRLLPVLDKVVRGILGEVDSYWRAFQTSLRDSDLRTLIEQATSSAPDGISLLRRMDIVIWTNNNEKFRRPS